MMRVIDGYNERWRKKTALSALNLFRIQTFCLSSSYGEVMSQLDQRFPSFRICDTLINTHFCHGTPVLLTLNSLAVNIFNIFKEA